MDAHHKDRCVGLFCTHVHPDAIDGAVVQAKAIAIASRIRASQAVPAALWAFVRYGKAPEECVIHAVNFGGDTDTIGAMAGALAASAPSSHSPNLR